ncbi:hypothetical protein F5Y02DRAFT_33821 [Annulohypoxylon stygium]|nr:hypothetical protein F5Y02DRAFT_33821 [Annulohypoxylon stygium]
MRVGVKWGFADIAGCSFFHFRGFIFYYFISRWFGFIVYYFFFFSLYCFFSTASYPRCDLQRSMTPFAARQHGLWDSVFVFLPTFRITYIYFFYLNRRNRTEQAAAFSDTKRDLRTSRPIGSRIPGDR